MFTGIIEERGQVKSIVTQGNYTTLLTVKALKVLEETKKGDSIAVNGVCLTVIKIDSSTVSFEVMAETLRMTTMGSLRAGDKVNLERSLKLQDRVSGHFVTGHIDAIGVIRKKNYHNKSLCFQIALPAALMRHIQPKGSVAIDGISLTVGATRPPTFTVYIIPHTLHHSTLELKGPSDKVNIECDILAKYAQARLC